MRSSCVCCDHVKTPKPWADQVQNLHSLTSGQSWFSPWFQGSAEVSSSCSVATDTWAIPVSDQRAALTCFRDQKIGAKESNKLQVPALKGRKFNSAPSVHTWKDAEPWTGREVPYGDWGSVLAHCGIPAQGIFPSAGHHAGHGATGNFSSSGGGVGVFLKISLVLSSSSLIAKCFLT